MAAITSWRRGRRRSRRSLSRLRERTLSKLSVRRRGTASYPVGGQHTPNRGNSSTTSEKSGPTGPRCRGRSGRPAIKRLVVVKYFIPGSRRTRTCHIRGTGARTCVRNQFPGTATQFYPGIASALDYVSRDNYQKADSLVDSQELTRPGRTGTTQTSQGVPRTRPGAASKTPSASRTRR